MSYYKVLGISENSKIDEIKKKYRKLAFKYHPDRNPQDEKALEKFREISEAYEVLGNSEKRQEYDRNRKKQEKSHTVLHNEKWKDKTGEKVSLHPDDIRNNFENFFNFKVNRKK